MGFFNSKTMNNLNLLSTLKRHNIGGFLFDFDNTIAPTNRILLDSILNMFSTEFDCVLNSEDVNHFLKQNQHLSVLFSNVISLTDLDVSSDTVLDLYRSTYAEQLYTFEEGFFDVLSVLKENSIPVAVVSNRRFGLKRRLLELGLSESDFIKVVSQEDGYKAKPEPEIFSVVVEEFRTLGVRADQIVSVGDHVTDFCISKFFDMNFLAFAKYSSTPEEFSSYNLPNTNVFTSWLDFSKALELSLSAKIYARSVDSVSVFDGRHVDSLIGLNEYFSEYALHKNRLRVMIAHLRCLGEMFSSEGFFVFDDDANIFFNSLVDEFEKKDALDVLRIDHLGSLEEGPIEHDLKSVEIYLSNKLKGTPYEFLIPSIHMFCTSEDVNNLAYKLMIKNSFDNLIIPSIEAVSLLLSSLSAKFNNSPLMGRTHVQPASLTTFGKFFHSFNHRIDKCIRKITDSVQGLKGKCNGAVGNYNSFYVAYPDLDWLGYSVFLTESLGLKTELITDQRGSFDDMCELIFYCQSLMSVYKDLYGDVILQAGYGNIKLEKVDSHVGSSVMPHKVNPWFFEVCEGNCKKFAWFSSGFLNELQVSRLQRDLSDHDFERSYGELFGLILIANNHMLQGLEKVSVDFQSSMDEIVANPQIFAENMQTILRKHGYIDAYSKLKELTRGKDLEMLEFINWIDENFEGELNSELKNSLKIENSLGIANKLSSNS